MMVIDLWQQTTHLWDQLRHAAHARITIRRSGWLFWEHVFFFQLLKFLVLFNSLNIELPYLVLFFLSPNPQNS